MIVLRRQGMALPVVLIFSVLTLAFVGSMVYFRKEVKQENVINVNFLQANFLAQAAINHALMKIRVLPQEAYDCAVTQKGYCPFQAIMPTTATGGGPKATGAPTDTFRSDCTETAVPWGLTDVPAAEWKYEIASISVISAYTDTTSNDLVLTVQLTAIGSVLDARGGRGWRKEQMVKTVELRRKQQL